MKWCWVPQVRNIVDNEDGALVDPAGYPLPPCIVMERGESLDLYSQRNAPDRATAFVVRTLRQSKKIQKFKFKTFSNLVEI